MSKEINNRNSSCVLGFRLNLLDWFCFWFIGFLLSWLLWFFSIITSSLIFLIRFSFLELVAIVNLLLKLFKFLVLYNLKVFIFIFNQFLILIFHSSDLHFKHLCLLLFLLLKQELLVFFDMLHNRIPINSCCDCCLRLLSFSNTRKR